MQRTRGRGAGTENARRDFEAIVERNFLVEQELRGVEVGLRRFKAPALLFPADEGCVGVIHADSLAQNGTFDRRRDGKFVLWFPPGDEGFWPAGRCRESLINQARPTPTIWGRTRLADAGMDAGRDLPAGEA